MVRASASSVAGSSGRNSWSGGSRRRMVTGQARHRAEDAFEVLALEGEDLVERVAARGVGPARIISRTAAMRSSSKNMCSVRQSPMPSAPKLRAVRASSGVSALARTRRRRTLSAQHHQLAELAAQRGGHRRHRAEEDLPAAAVEGDRVARLHRHDLRRVAGGVVDGHRHRLVLLAHADRGAAGDAALAHPARDDGRVARHAAAGRQDAARRLHPVDVLRRRLRAHQDDRLALARRAARPRPP